MWSGEFKDAFTKIKAILVLKAVLTAPDFTQPFIMAIDASDEGIGSVLLQRGEDRIDHLISYY